MGEFQPFVVLRVKHVGAGVFLPLVVHQDAADRQPQDPAGHHGLAFVVRQRQGAGERAGPAQFPGVDPVHAGRPIVRDAGQQRAEHDRRIVRVGTKNVDVLHFLRVRQGFFEHVLGVVVQRLNPVEHGAQFRSGAEVPEGDFGEAVPVGHVGAVHQVHHGGVHGSQGSGLA